MNYFKLETGQCRDESGNVYHPELSLQLEEDAFDCGFVDGGGPIDIAKMPLLFGVRPKQAGRNVGIDAFKTGQWTVFSSQLKEVIDSVAAGYVQFAPFEIRSHDGKDIQDGYFAVRIVHRVSCVDRVRSTVWNDDWTPRINGTLKLNEPVVFSLSAMSDYPILMSQEYVGFLVREDVKEAIERFDFLLFTQVATS